MSVEVPEGWEESRLQELCYFQEGPGLRRWQFAGGGFPFINIRCIVNGKIDKSQVQFITEKEALEKYSHFHLQAGDFVLSSSGTIGRMAKVEAGDLPLMLNTSVIRFRSLDKKRFDDAFLPYFLQSGFFFGQIQRETQGSAQGNFGPSHLKKVVVPLPPLPEQQKIAEILSSVDEAIQSTEAVIEQTKKVKQGVMNQLLTKGIGHTRFKQTEIGEIPDEWEVVPLDAAIANPVAGVSVNSENIQAKVGCIRVF